MRKVNYKEKGITLIALVVTIIILLILAGVTLSTALSQNGLFQRAKIAGENYKRAEADETEKLGEVEKEIDKIVNGETPPDPPSSGIGSSDVAKNLKEFQGKYVDIGLDTNDNHIVDDWEIFYVNEGRIFLIAADYVPASKLETWNIIGDSGSLKDNGFEQSYENKYNVNWSEPKTFLEENLPDLDLVMHNRYDLNSNKTNDNSIAVSHLLNTDKWKGIREAASEEKRQYIDFVIGGPTLEMWCAAWTKAIEGNEYGFVALEAESQTSGNGYKVKYNGKSYDSLDVNGDSSEPPDKSNLGKYKTFFPHTLDYENCAGYWLASPSAQDLQGSDCLMGVEYDGRIVVEKYNDLGVCVRPVVCLEDGVEIVKRDEAVDVYDVTR